MEEVRPEVERLAWATPPVWILDRDVLYPDRPSSFISETVVCDSGAIFFAHWREAPGENTLDEQKKVTRQGAEGAGERFK